MAAGRARAAAPATSTTKSHSDQGGLIQLCGLRRAVLILLFEGHSAPQPQGQSPQKLFLE